MNELLQYLCKLYEIICHTAKNNPISLKLSEVSKHLPLLFIVYIVRIVFVHRLTLSNEVLRTIKYWKTALF